MVDDGKKQSEQPHQGLPPVDPRLLTAIYGMQEEDEIDLLEYWRVIWKQKLLILSITFVVALLAAAYSLTLPNIYRAEVLLAPVKAEESRSGGLASALGGIGGLVSMAGISLGDGGSVEENLAVLTSRKFLWLFIKENKLMPILFSDQWNAESKSWKTDDVEAQPSLWDAYRLLRGSGMLNVSTDKNSGLVRVAVESKYPEKAAFWANKLVARLNQYLRQQAIIRNNLTLKYLHSELEHTSVADMRQVLFGLIAQEQKKAMLANTQEQFAFQVLDAAVAPDRKSKPKRSLIVILAAFVAGFLAVVFVLIREGVKKRESVAAENG